MKLQYILINVVPGDHKLRVLGESIFANHDSLIL